MAIKQPVTLPKCRAIRTIFRVLKDCSNLAPSFAKTLDGIKKISSLQMKKTKDVSQHYV